MGRGEDTHAQSSQVKSQTPSSQSRTGHPEVELAAQYSTLGVHHPPPPCQLELSARCCPLPYTQSLSPFKRHLQFKGQFTKPSFSDPSDRLIWGAEPLPHWSKRVHSVSKGFYLNSWLISLHLKGTRTLSRFILRTSRRFSPNQGHALNVCAVNSHKMNWRLIKLFANEFL